MTVICHNAEKPDLKPAMAVVAAALNDLEESHGFEGISEEIDTSFAEFCLADNPSGLWVAEAGERIVGFGFSWVAEHLWFLADLFVEPEWQSSGVGRMLLERTLDQARKSNSSVRALITFAYNRTSLGLYMKHGMYPRIPLYAWSLTRSRLTADRSEVRLGHEPLVRESQLEAVESIDHKHHRFSLHDPNVRGFLFKDEGGAAAGYVYVSQDGRIGPLAVGSPTSKPFGDWTRYCPRGPGYM